MDELPWFTEHLFTSDPDSGAAWFLILRIVIFTLTSTGRHQYSISEVVKLRPREVELWKRAGLDYIPGPCLTVRPTPLPRPLPPSLHPGLVQAFSVDSVDLFRGPSAGTGVCFWMGPRHRQLSKWCGNSLWLARSHLHVVCPQNRHSLPQFCFVSFLTMLTLLSSWRWKISSVH